MPESIVIERLEFRGRCGVTAEEVQHSVRKEPARIQQARNTGRLDP